MTARSRKLSRKISDMIAELRRLRPGKKASRAQQKQALLEFRRDEERRQRSMRLVGGLMRSLKRAFPEVNPQLIGDIVADLDDLWDYGQELDRDLWALCKIRLPRDRDALQSLLTGIEVQQFDYARDCIERLHKNLPKLDKYLYRDDPGPSRRRRVSNTTEERGAGGRGDK